MKKILVFSFFSTILSVNCFAITLDECKNLGGQADFDAMAECDSLKFDSLSKALDEIYKKKLNSLSGGQKNAFIKQHKKWENKAFEACQTLPVNVRVNCEIDAFETRIKQLSK